MSNPQFKKVIEKNPEMAQIFNDPEYLKQVIILFDIFSLKFNIYHFICLIIYI